MTQDYKAQWNQYPIYSSEMSYEGSFKRFSQIPSPKEVYDSALFGIPKRSPLTGEEIPVSMVESYLSSAVAEIEQELGCNLSPIDHYEVVDYIDGMFNNNYTGIRLTKWPATEVISVQIKFPNAATNNVFQQYSIPAAWVMLRSNRVNITPAAGAVVSTSQDGGNAVLGTGGAFAYMGSAFNSAYVPGHMQVVYKAGYSEDKLPSNVADLVKTWAAYRFMVDIIPILFPQNSVSVGLDGVSQSVGLNISQMLTQRVTMLDAKRKELSRAFVKAHGRTVKMAFIGA